MNIAIDFDGTCTTHNFPFLGKDIGAIPILKSLVKNGHNLVLFTLRGTTFHDGKKMYRPLDDAIKWFENNQIPLYGIFSTPDQTEWTDSPKPDCRLFIDDAALGCPLIFDPFISDRPFVDWKTVKKLLIYNGLIKF